MDSNQYRYSDAQIITTGSKHGVYVRDVQIAEGRRREVAAVLDQPELSVDPLSESAQKWAVKSAINDSPIPSDKLPDLLLNSSIIGFYVGRFMSGGESVHLHDSLVESQFEVYQGEQDFTVLRHVRCGLEFRFERGRLVGIRARAETESIDQIIWKIEKTDSEGRVVAHSNQRAGVKHETRLMSHDPHDAAMHFRFLDVRDGHVVHLADEPNIKMVLHEGIPVRLIDPIAERRIDDILIAQGLQPISESKTESAYLRRSFLGSLASSKQCGVYSFAYAAALLRIRVPLADVLRSEYMSSEFGSSARDLVKAANDFGIVAQPISNGSMDLLRWHSWPALLHFRNMAGDGGHWVVFAGFDNSGKVQIVDLPDDTASVDVADVMTYWDGNLILLSREAPSRWMIVASRCQQAGALFGVFGILAITSVLFRRARFVSIGPQALILILAVIGFAAAWLTFGRMSYARHPVAATMLLGRAMDQDLIVPEVTVVDPAMEQLIDARPANQYSIGHIPGALNVPIDCRMNRWRELLDQIDPNRRVIVYCDNPRCVWADTVARRLDAMGFASVAIYRPGYQGYRAIEFGDAR